MGSITEKISINGQRISSGIAGLDSVLFGGFLPHRAYLIRGGPGAGKTSVGLHFLQTDGPVLYISLGEPADQIRANARTIGLDVSHVHFLDLSPTSDFFAEVQTYDIFSPADVEREPTTQHIVETVRELKPSRIFVDSMTQFRYFSSDAFQFRKQALSFMRFMIEAGATVLFTSESSPEAPDEDLQFLADGVIEIRKVDDLRQISVTKFRGSDFLPGWHHMRITPQGVCVIPRLQLTDTPERSFDGEILASGIPELDELLHGGLERGSVTIFSGPTGVGKSTLGLQFMKEASGRGERSVVYTFEEHPDVLLARCRNLHMPVDAMQHQGVLQVKRIEPLQYTADEFAHMVRTDVDERQTRIVMIDSISGYRLSLRGEDMVAHLHALSQYLCNRGVTVLLIHEVESIVGDFKATDVGISYLADNIVFMRYLEIRGELRRAIGVLKKRQSDFEKTLREYTFTRYGIKVGEPLTRLRGILSGVPEFLKEHD